MTSASNIKIRAARPRPEDLPPARYAQVKDYVRERIVAGEWQAGDRIPSEINLVDKLGMSRMTINRALRELAEAGVLMRQPGVGTFVAAPKPQSTLLMIAQVGDEIRARGHEYTYSVPLVAREAALPEVSSALDLRPGASVFHVVCVHRENHLPVQLEDRYVNPAVVPQFLEQDFTRIRPSEYLFRLMPAHEIEHIVDAGWPTRHEADLLEIEFEAPCLTLTRRTWNSGIPVTFSRFIHPGTRYRLGCRFKPDAMQQHS